MGLPNVILLFFGIGFLYGGLRTLILCLRKAYPVELMRGKLWEAFILIAFGLASLGGILLLRILFYGRLITPSPPPVLH